MNPFRKRKKNMLYQDVYLLECQENHWDREDREDPLVRQDNRKVC